jgi:hypothetical protein
MPILFSEAESMRTGKLAKSKKMKLPKHLQYINPTRRALTLAVRIELRY